MKIGILGGSFDPPHQLHLQLAQNAIEELGLDEVLFIPCWKAPDIKHSKIVATPQQRFKMVQQLIENQSKMSISDIEITRREISYTVDTLSELNQIYPGDYWLLMDSSAAIKFMEWKMPEKIASYCRLAVNLSPSVTEGEVLLHLPEFVRTKIDFIHQPVSSITYKELQEMMMDGMPIDRWINKKNIEFINQHKIYKTL